MSLPASVFELLALLSSRDGRISDTEVPDRLRNALKICEGNTPPLIAQVPLAGAIPNPAPAPIWKLTRQAEAALARHSEDASALHVQAARVFASKSEQAAREALANQEREQREEVGNSRVWALARVLGDLNVLGLQRSNTDAGRAVLVDRLVAAAQLPLADGKTRATEAFSQEDGEYWTIARAIITAAEGGDKQTVESHLRNAATLKPEEHAEFWKRVALVLDIPVPIPTANAGVVEPETQSGQRNVGAWLAEWRSTLEQEFPDPIDRLRALAFRCTSEGAWTAPRATLAAWQAAQQKVNDQFRRRRAELETSNGHVQVGSSLYWSLVRQLQQDPIIKESQREEVDAHCQYWRACFESIELYRLLWQHRAGLLAEFGPPVRLDESYTPRERAERCNGVLAKLVAENGVGADNHGDRGWSPDRLATIADNARTLARHMQTVLAMGTDPGSDGVFRLVLRRLQRLLGTDAMEAWTIGDLDVTIVLRRLRAIATEIAQDAAYLPSNDHIAALLFAADSLEGFANGHGQLAKTAQLPDVVALDLSAGESTNPRPTRSMTGKVKGEAYPQFSVKEYASIADFASRAVFPLLLDKQTRKRFWQQWVMYLALRGTENGRPPPFSYDSEDQYDIEDPERPPLVLCERYVELAAVHDAFCPQEPPLLPTDNITAAALICNARSLKKTYLRRLERSLMVVKHDLEGGSSSDETSAAQQPPSTNTALEIPEYDVEKQPWNTELPPIKDVQSQELVSYAGKVDLLLITANQSELEAVLRQMQSYRRRKAVLKGFVEHETYYLGRFAGHPAVVTKCRMGSLDSGSATLATQDGQRIWCPRAVIMVGVAFGRGSSEQRIADVLVASQVISYEPERVGITVTVPRGPIVPVNTTLLNRFENVTGWTFCRPDGSRCACQVGPLLSGEKLVDDPVFKADLFRKYPRAIGGEMEGVGLTAAAVRHQVPWILVKAICDWGDGNKHKKHQPLAAAAAVSLVQWVLSHADVLHGLAKPAMS
jgi:nucleoside phosphorylase